MVPLLVRAHLAHGIAHAAPWGVSLDGLLAAEMWDEHKAQARERGEVVPRLDPMICPPDLDLPLSRCTVSGDQWHWAATFAFPETPAERPVVRYWTARPDHLALGDLVAELPAVVSDRQGPYRARSMPLLITSTQTVCWRGVGDIDAVRDILSPLVAIGKKRSQGEGQVLRWEVTELDEVDDYCAGHLHPDGSLGRTAPDQCLRRQSVSTGGYGLAGLRPPYVHPARRHTLHLPAG